MSLDDHESISASLFGIAAGVPENGGRRGGGVNKSSAAIVSFCRLYFFHLLFLLPIRRMFIPAVPRPGKVHAM